MAPDGSRIATAGPDRNLRVWDANTGGKLLDVVVDEAAFKPTPDHPIPDIAYDPDGMPHFAQSQYVPVGEVLFTRDGNHLITISNAVRIWDSHTGTLVRKISGDMYGALSPDGGLFAEAGGTNANWAWRLWKTTTGEQVSAGQNLDRRDIRALAVSTDNNRVASAAGNGTVRLWDAGTGGQIAALASHEDDVNRVAFSPDGTLLVTASDDGTARLWNAIPGKMPGTTVLQGPDGSQDENWAKRAIISPGGQYGIMPLGSKTARVWDTRTGRSLAMLDLGEARPGYDDSMDASYAFSPDGMRIAAFADGAVHVFDTVSGTERSKLQPEAVVKDCGHWAPSGGCVAIMGNGAFSPNGTRIVAVPYDGVVRVFDSVSGSQVLALEGSRSEISAAFSTDGKLIVSVGRDGSVRVWDALSGRERGTVSNSADGFVEMSGSSCEEGRPLLSPSGDRVALWKNDKIRIQSVFSGKVIGEIHFDDVGYAKTSRIDAYCVAFSRDSSRIVAELDDGTVRVWATEAGSELALFRLPRDDMSTSTLTFSPDGAYVLVADPLILPRLFSVANEAEVAILDDGGAGISRASFTPDGARVVTIEEDGATRLWPVFHSTQDLIEHAWRIVPRRSR
jgi:WD40 repeat protein